jgi:STE24 endopeptidase
MRLSIVWGWIGLVGAATLAWGWSVGGEQVPARPNDLITAVPAAWYADLPLDPAAAANAYLARIPAAMRERGERYSDTRMLAFDLRVLSLIFATVVLCATRMVAQARELTVRFFSRRTLVDTAVALQYFIALYVLSLPVELYATFIRPRRFGFSEQTFGAWLGDSLVNWGVFTAFYVVGVLVIYTFIRRRPTQWVAWAAGIYLVLRATFTLLSPNVIEPLTNTFQPLAEGPQKQQILALAHANGINDVAVVTGDASRQTRLLNAHVSGIGGAARISVDDTTLRATSDSMLRAVVGHEIGHYVMNHEIQGIVTDTLIMSAGFALIALGTRAVVRRLGARWQMSAVGDIASLPVFWGLFLLWGFASLPASNAISRSFEDQADLYGLNASQAPLGLAEFMIHDADTVRLQPTTAEYALFYTHPSDAERVATAMQWRAASARLPAL